MSPAVGLNGIERREAIRTVERAADVVASSRWFGFVIVLVLTSPIARFFFLLPMTMAPKIVIGVVLVSIALVSTYPFLSSAENIRLRRRRTVGWWLLASLIVVALSLTAAVLFVVFALDQPDPLAHIIMAVLMFGCVVYGVYFMIVMMKAFRAVNNLTADNQASGQSTSPDLTQPNAPNSVDAVQASDGAPATLMPPRPPRSH
ncbi:MAG TPA: hypothetical protein PK402_08335 [Tepidisphaeraceae bacterium]|nr:hypothetical protein [Tepidisphaeraceae bacterium]